MALQRCVAATEVDNIPSRDDASGQPKRGKERDEENKQSQGTVNDPTETKKKSPTGHKRGPENLGN